MSKAFWRTNNGVMFPFFLGNGDSGGPIACKLENDPEQGLYFCGIASFGPNRCPNYSVYTRVSKYVKWIEEEVAKRS